MAYSAQQPEGGERLNGMVVQIVFQSMETGFCVLELLSGGETVPVVGELAGVAPGEELTLTGSWVEHVSFGRSAANTACRIPRRPFCNTFPAGCCRAWGRCWPAASLMLSASARWRSCRPSRSVWPTV